MRPVTQPAPRPGQLRNRARPGWTNLLIGRGSRTRDAFFRDVWTFRPPSRSSPNDGQQLATWLERSPHPARHRDRHRGRNGAMHHCAFCWTTGTASATPPTCCLQTADHRRRATGTSHRGIRSTLRHGRQQERGASPAATGRPGLRADHLDREEMGRASSTTTASQRALSRCTVTPRTEKGPLRPYAYGPYRAPYYLARLPNRAGQAVPPASGPSGGGIGGVVPRSQQSRRGGRSPLPSRFRETRHGGPSSALRRGDGEALHPSSRHLPGDKEIVRRQERRRRRIRHRDPR